jgi:hypothetical protein
MRKPARSEASAYSRSRNGDRWQRPKPGASFDDGIALLREHVATDDAEVAVAGCDTPAFVVAHEQQIDGRRRRGTRSSRAARNSGRSEQLRDGCASRPDFCTAMRSRSRLTLPPRDRRRAIGGDAIAAVALRKRATRPVVVTLTPVRSWISRYAMPRRNHGITRQRSDSASARPACRDHAGTRALDRFELSIAR